MCRLTFTLLVCLLATPVFAQIDRAYSRSEVPGHRDEDIGHLSAISRIQSDSDWTQTEFTAAAASFAQGYKKFQQDQINYFYARTFAEIKEVATNTTVFGFASANAISQWTDTARVRVPSLDSPPPVIRFSFHYNGIRTITPTAAGHGDKEFYNATAAGHLTINGDGIPINSGQRQIATISPAGGFQDVTTGNPYFVATMIPTPGVPNEYQTRFTVGVYSYVDTTFAHSVTSDYSHSFYLTEPTLEDGRPLSDEGYILWFDSDLEVPEPTSFLLGLIALGTCFWLKARRATCR